MTAGFKVLAHGIVGGVRSVLSGARFEQGFLAAGFTEAFSPVISYAGASGGIVAEYSTAALIGGCGSQLAGGKFADGAMTGVLSSIFSGGIRQGENGGGLFNGALDMLGKIWTLPNTIAGLAYGGIGHVAGWIMGTNPQIEFGHNAIQFINNPFVKANSAFTLGNTILYGSNTPPSKPGAYGDLSVNVGYHEEAHTYQYQILGPFFAPTYMATGGFSGPSYSSLEQAAQNYGRNPKEGGWWSW